MNRARNIFITPNVIKITIRSLVSGVLVLQLSNCAVGAGAVGVCLGLKRPVRTLR